MSTSLESKTVCDDQVNTTDDIESGMSSSATDVPVSCSNTSNSTKRPFDKTHNFVDEESYIDEDKDHNVHTNFNSATSKSKTDIKSNLDGMEKLRLPTDIDDMVDRVTFAVGNLDKVKTDIMSDSAISKTETGVCELSDILADRVVHYDIQNEEVVSDTEDSHKLQRSRVIRKRPLLKSDTKIDGDNNMYENREDNVEIEDEMESESNSDADEFFPEGGVEVADILLQRFHEWVRIQGDDLEPGFIDDLLFDPDDLDIDLDLAAAFPPKVNYPCSQLKENSECQVCLVETSTRDRLCCTLPVCDDCMDSYVKEKVLNGSVTIPCIGHSCNSNIFRDEVLDRLQGEMKDKYYQFLVDANGDPMVKTCPRCSYIYDIKKDKIVKEKKWRKKKGIQVTCPKCALHWCFPCQAPWHEGMTCKDYNKGNKLLKSWAKEYHHGQNNAQKCPKCKVFIERRSGCDHMTCSKCATSFCYRCGERYISVNMIGDHHGRFSPFGCKYNLLPERPIARKAVRGGILGAKVLGGMLLGPLIVAGGALVLATSVITLPIYGVHKYKKHRRRMELLAFDRNYTLQRAAAKIPVPAFDATPESGPAQSTETNPEDEESKATSTADATPDSESEAEHAQEVEVWVHYQHQGEQTSEQEVDEPTTHSADREEATVTTAKMSKDGNETDVLYVTTSYTNTKGQGCSEISSDNAEKEEHAENAKKTCKGVEPDVTPIQKKENESTDNSKQDPKGEVITGDENSTSQGCFVQLFGKKLPVVWEKENKEINGPEDGKSVADKEGKFSTSSLEKKHTKSHVSTESRRLKQRGQSTSEKLKTQPDLVQCSLHGKQYKSDVVKPDFDSDVMPVVKHFPDMDLDTAGDVGSGNNLEKEDIFMVIDCSRL